MPSQLGRKLAIGCSHIWRAFIGASIATGSVVLVCCCWIGAVSIASGVAADRSAGATALADRPAATALAGVDPALALAAAGVESLWSNSSTSSRRF